MSSSKVLFFLCLAFILGVAVESAVKIPQVFLWVFLFAVLIVILVSGIKLFLNSQELWNSFLIGGFCLLVLILGILRIQTAEFKMSKDVFSKLIGTGKVTFEGIVAAEPDVRDTYQKLKIKTGESLILVNAARYPEYKYLDKLKVEGQLEAPMETPDFNYKNYLMKDGIYSVMGFPKVELVLKKHEYNVFSFLYERVLFLKEKLRKSIHSNFSTPHGLILEGTVLGDSGGLTNELKEKLNITGLRHVIAVSGTHIVILGMILMPFLIFLGLKRPQAFYFCVASIWLYIILTGLPASGVRAGIMATVFLFAQKIGRQSGGERLVTLAAAAMLLLNPLLLFYDVGFQLSFLAVLGLVFLEPLIRNFLANSAKRIFKKFEKNISISKKYERFLKKASDKGFQLITIISATFAAQIFTLPIMIYNFGNMSLVSPITNILILPIVEPLMITGFLSAFLGSASNFLGWVFFLPCWVLLEYFLRVIDFFSKPWAMKTFENVSLVWLIISYAIIIFATWLFNKKAPRPI